MTNIIRLPANTDLYLESVYDSAQDKFDVVDMTFEYAGQTNILRLPANTQAYLTVERNSARDTFDIREFTFNYGLEAAPVAFPEPWAYWKMDETGGTRADSISDHDLVESALLIPSYASGVISNAIKMEVIDFETAGLTCTANTPSMTEWSFVTWFNFPNATWGYSGVALRFGDLSVYLNSWGETYGEGFNINVGGISGWEFGSYDYYWGDASKCNSWHMLSIYYDGSTHIEIDGVELGSISGTAIITSAETVSVDIWNVADGVVVLIDEWGIWTQALTAGQQSYLYNSGAGKTYPFSDYAG